LHFCAAGCHPSRPFLYSGRLIGGKTMVAALLGNDNTVAGNGALKWSLSGCEFVLVTGGQ
jgi:hypothetical protein